jgi:hypothetical protein
MWLDDPHGSWFKSVVAPVSTFELRKFPACASHGVLVRGQPTGGEFLSSYLSPVFELILIMTPPAPKVAGNGSRTFLGALKRSLLIGAVAGAELGFLSSFLVPVLNSTQPLDLQTMIGASLQGFAILVLYLTPLLGLIGLVVGFITGLCEPVVRRVPRRTRPFVRAVAHVLLFALILFLGMSPFNGQFDPQQVTLSASISLTVGLLFALASAITGRFPVFRADSRR